MEVEQELKHADPESRNRCSECGKQFPSRKSLFGHMRCHPHRHWRGVKPPPDQFPISDQAKRRLPLENSSSSDPDQELDAALFLVMLARSSENKKKTSKRTRLEEENWFVKRRGDLQMSVRESGGHECSVCGKIFSTGQALGGHKRCHWTGGGKMNRVRDGPVLDLNEPAPLSGEDLEAACSMIDVVPACIKSLRFHGFRDRRSIVSDL